MADFAHGQFPPKSKLRALANRQVGLQRWVNSSKARRHPLTRLLSRLALGLAVAAPLLVARVSGYLAVTNSLEAFYQNKLVHFVDRHRIAVSADAVGVESLVATDRSLVVWQKELVRLRSELMRETGGAVGEVDADNSHLEFETGEDAEGHRSVSTAVLVHFALMVISSLAYNPNIALACIILNVILLRLTLRLQQVSDGFGTALDHLDEAHMEFVLTPLDQAEELVNDHVALKNLCLHKFSFLKSYWNGQTLGITLGAPIWVPSVASLFGTTRSAAFAVTLSLPLIISLLTASSLHCAPMLLRLHPMLETLPRQIRAAVWERYVSGLFDDAPSASANSESARHDGDRHDTHSGAVGFHPARRRQRSPHVDVEGM